MILGLIAATLLATTAGAIDDDDAAPPPTPVVEVPDDDAPPLARDEDAPPRPTPMDDEAPSPFTLRPELQLGDDAPLGLTSLSIVVGPRDWLSLGAGLGFANSRTNALNYGLFARAHLLRFGAFKLGPTLTASRTDERIIVASSGLETATWFWIPGYRLDAGVGIEAKVGRLSARLDGGVGYVLGEPMCLHYNSGMSYRGGCPAPEAPPQFVSTRGAVPVYLAVSVGLDVQAAPPPALGAPADPDRSVWYGGPAVLADLSVLVFGALAARHDDGLFALSAAAYFLGGPVNHIARGHNRRGLASLGLRAAGAAVTAATLVGILTGCVEGDSANCAGWAVLLPLGPLAAMIIDDAWLSREPL